MVHNVNDLEIIESLPTENYDTLQYLLRHLLKITEYREHNRMHISNLAIVFGPTLMWAATVSNNLALDMMQQNLVVEALLNNYHNIFNRWFVLVSKRIQHLKSSNNFTWVWLLKMTGNGLFLSLVASMPI